MDNKVKKLEWVEEVSATWWTADAYRIEVFDGGGFAARVSSPQSRAFRTIAYGVSFEAAKAAAQADYERRILSALEPSPSPDMREAVEARPGGSTTAFTRDQLDRQSGRLWEIVREDAELMAAE